MWFDLLLFNETLYCICYKNEIIGHPVALGYIFCFFGADRSAFSFNEKCLTTFQIGFLLLHILNGNVGVMIKLVFHYFVF